MRRKPSKPLHHGELLLLSAELSNQLAFMFHSAQAAPSAGSLPNL
jgi:hypothetical protein